jgi:hypothetical protein
MIFELRQTIHTKDGTVWVSRGSYPIVGLFDNTRIIINVGGAQRELTIVPLWKGLVKRNGK